MSGLKSLLLLVWLAIAGLVLVQNQTPIAVVLLGVTSPLLPLGLWAIGAAAIGSLTMVLVASLVSLGGGRRAPLSGSRTSHHSPDPRDPAPGSTPPRRPFAGFRTAAIDDQPEDTPEIWDNDEAWNDRDRQVSQFVPNLDSPPEPWELLEEEPADRPSPNTSESRFDPSNLDEQEEREALDNLDEPAEQGEPLDLPPTSSYERPQQPTTVFRQGSVYSFSYEKQAVASEDEPPKPPLNLGKQAAMTGEASPDCRVPIDIPARGSHRRPDPLDALEEITPIVEPIEPTAPPPNPDRRSSTSPGRVRDLASSSPSSQRDPKVSRPNTDPTNVPTQTPVNPATNPAANPPTETPSDDWDRDWREPANDDADWI